MVTDRTARNVARLQELQAIGIKNFTAAEKLEWTLNSKGAYNYTDLNRVENAVAYLAELLNANGYPVVLQVVKTNWTATDVPTVTEMTRYLENVRLIRAAFHTLSTTPQAPTSMSGLTYDKANAIEQILADVDLLLNNMISSYTYSGDVFGGEV